nr:sigma-54-dependent Fis family transcriptional regulator [Cupriavidus basilensis]
MLPQGVLRQEIEASWDRSMRHGIDRSDSKLVDIQFDADWKTLREANRLLIDAASPEMSFLVARYGHDGIAILADADANMLLVEGRTDYLQELGIRDVAPGACWSEAMRGTNALGTALVDSKPTLINSGEHYLECLRRLSCASAPIRDPRGQLIGVLDVTREGVLTQPRDSLSMLMLAARQIECRLFGAYYPENIVLAFHRREPHLDSAWRGMVVLSCDGDILAADQQACSLLMQDRSAVVGRRSEDILGIRGSQLVARVMREGVSKVTNASGEFFFRAVQIPRPAPSIPAAEPDTARAAPGSLDRLAGANHRLARGLHMARRGLDHDVPVLLLGETGTGKEVTARALHDASVRAGKPFVAVNCASIPEGLIESELFGYREGAFTGARKGGVVGRLSQANGGTLFLDEIGDMPLHLQARLLRVLQERKVAPLGAAEEQAIDVALVCATHRDLKLLVQEKTFREDLYYRINGIGVSLPPLRERQDIGDLANVLLAKLGAPHATLDSELSELIEQFDWPGNIRQLEMVLRSALAMREEGETALGTQHLTDAALDELQAGARQSAGLIRDREMELIRDSLGSHQGNVSAAAQALGISRATLYRKLKQLRT